MNVAVVVLLFFIQRVACSETCDGGCFVATIPAPRVCECVQPTCAQSDKIGPTKDPNQLVSGVMEWFPRITQQIAMCSTDANHAVP
jgi:hypothetical protein